MESEMMMDCASVREQLQNDNQFFKKMVKLIPSRYTLAEPTDTPSNNSKVKKTGIAGREQNKQDTLRESLQKKLMEFKAKRTKPGAVVDSVEKKRLKRRLSKLKLKQRRKAEKQKCVEGTKPADGKTKKTTPKTTPIFNKDGKIVFSKFDFSNSTSQKDNRKAEIPTGKNYKVLLDQAAKKKEKMSELERMDREQAREVSRKEKWKSVLSKAEGIKVRDNPELLKKALKRQEKKKEHSRKKWEAREEHVEKQMKDRQDKRTKNIAKKKEGRVNKKLKKANKHGRVSVS